ncbi:MAG TPA: nicotinate-nucleotide adenylyltransferase [Casimicrobiaceae bacterium]|nr:nicotinate-nucleotide adenylyltransferase [Casimicrobiaceae bacterium]
MRTIGILGGTFDPIHYGHLRFAADVRAMLDLACILIIPAGDPWHRTAPVASAQARLAMVELACAEFPGLIADGREVRRPGPSYTVTTLQELHDVDPSRPLGLLVGTDALAGLARWHRWELLLTLSHLIVAERPGVRFDAQKLSEPLRTQYERRLTTDRSRLSRTLAGAILRVPITPQPISATAIRDALARGAAGRAEVAGLLPAEVLAYIDRNQLYRPPTDAT